MSRAPTPSPRPSRRAAEQARADAGPANAKLEIASLDVQRAAPLIQNQTLTGREFDTRKSAQRDAAGQVASAEATLKQAELNPEWTAVRAPISGRISDRRAAARPPERGRPRATRRTRYRSGFPMRPTTSMKAGWISSTMRSIRRAARS